MGRIRAYVGLGANVGAAADTLAAAVHALAALPGVRLVGVSRLYATTPVGVTDQPEFRNAVVALDVPGGRDPETGALALLIALKGLERAFGRRDGPRWGPPRWTWTCWSSGATRSAPSGRPGPAAATAGTVTAAIRPASATLPAPPRSGSPSPTRAPASACSCLRRWPTWPPAFDHPAGASPWGRPGDGPSCAKGRRPFFRSANGTPMEGAGWASRSGNRGVAGAGRGVAGADPRGCRTRSRLAHGGVGRTRPR